nr:7944_t:CDS:2 [Entrophospora candida]
MVINNNEQEFQGKTLQEYLNWKYPTKEDKEKVKRIDIYKINKDRRKLGITELLEGGELNLKPCLNSPPTKLTLGNKPKLTQLYCSGNQITSLDFSGCSNLTQLNFSNNLLTSIDFLKQLPHPEKLTYLALANNNIEPTNLEFLRPFINLTQKLTLGNDKSNKYILNIYNRFYGSLEPLRGMTKLEGLCIDGTNVEEGLEYLPTANKTAKIVRQETQIKILEEVENQLREQIEEEREIHTDTMKNMDNFYQQNPPQENIRLKNILQEFEKKYLELNREKQAKEKEVKELKQSIEITNKILEQEHQPKETKEQGTQTDLNNLELEQQKTIRELEQKVKDKELAIPRQLEITNKDGNIFTKSENAALAGTFNSLISNLIEGVVKGCEDIVEVKGVGFKVFLKEGKLEFTLGKSHLIYVTIPQDLEVKVEGNKITVKGLDKQEVRNFTANKIRPFLSKLGVENCLALLGTNLSEEQIKLLIELKKRIILFLDSDKAGQEATINATVKLLSREIDCEVVRNDYRSDPDEICRQQDKEAVQNILRERENPYLFVLKHCFAK